MSQSQNDVEEDDEVESTRARVKQPRVNVEIQAAEAQRIAARATLRNARYMLWAVIIAAISTLISTAGAVYGLLANLLHAPR
jgi:predicted anti-sigma-YlaC factor YlaD